MNTYSEIFVALDFADKYGAVAVRVEVDGGYLTMPAKRALEVFDGLQIGEPFALKTIYFDGEEVW